MKKKNIETQSETKFSAFLRDQSLNKLFYYKAELVRAEKELSEWFPERSEFSYTEKNIQTDCSRKDLTKLCFGNV